MITKFSSYNCVNLYSLVDMSIGKTPSRANLKYWGLGKNWLSIADMKSDLEVFETKEQITELAIKETGIKIVPKGSILFSFKLSIGKVAIAGKDLYTNEAIAAFKIRDKNKVYSKFLYYVLKEFDFSGTGDKAVMGLTLNQKKLRNMQIPLPPLETQKKIAAILDKADELRQNDKKILEKYDQLAQSVFLEMFGNPVRNDRGWETKTIEELVKKSKWAIKRGPFGGALKKEIFVDNGYLVYEQYHALNNDFTFERYYIDEHKFQELKAFEVKPKDIIISCSGVYLGKLAILPDNAKKGIINQALLKITLDENIMKNEFFVNHFLYKNFKEKYFDSNRGAGIPNFPPMTEFKKFPFITPPIKEQMRFINVLKNIDNQRTISLLSLQKSEDLYQSFLQRAFKGEL